MKINSTKFYTALFVIVLFLQLYLPSFKINIFIQIAILLLFFQFEKLQLTSGFLKALSFVIALFFIGFLGTIFNRYPIVAVIKDIFHFLKPLLGLLIGYCFYRKIDDFRVFVKTIVLVGFLSGIVHFIIVFLFSNADTVSGIREFGKDNFLELFALFFLGYYKKFQEKHLFQKRLYSRLIFLTLLSSCLLYLSRTMMIVSIIILLSVHGYTIITKAALKAAGIVVLLLIGFYLFLYSVNIQRDKKGIEAFLYKVKIAPAEIFKTKIDRDNHKDLWDHWRGYEAKRAFALMNDNPKSYIVGSGYGSLVNLKFPAPLSDDAKGMKFISELHNGYIYILYKTGIFGMLIYLSFLIGLYKKIYVHIDMATIFISAIGMSYLFTTLTITGIYNASDTIIFILGALLFFKGNVNSKTIES